ncbi:MAG: hypothetical protein F6K17_36525 [Okeania sp. SIO3C4]|nr:hypothetical protein [Okeania sp. SIO3C4]
MLVQRSRKSDRSLPVSGKRSPFPHPRQKKSALARVLDAGSKRDSA